MGKGTRAAGSARGGGTRGAGSPRGYGSGPQSGQQPPQSRAEARQAPASPPRKSGRGATFSVLMMTIATLVGVGVLAAQAEATAPRVHAQSGGNASTTKTTTKTGSSGTSTNTYALPANSGSGTRIVYSAGQRRIWLAQDGTVERTMAIVPGTETPSNGSYTVTSKVSSTTASDGVQVVYVVRFGGSYGFDAEQGITGMPPAPTGTTGGVRMTQVDAQVLYSFASVGTAVVVVS
ncbi:MAG TPA: L,D-transpeptidase [Actinospica sp.]|nr:L,D-transpeptidase [Actinospica sp.]